MFIKKIIFFVIAAVLIFSCDNELTDTSDVKTLITSDSTINSLYYKAANQLILRNTFYNARYFENSTFKSDTSYFQSTLFFKDSNSTQWNYAEFNMPYSSFENKPFVVYRPSSGDSIIIEYCNEQFLIEIINNFELDTLEYNSSLSVINPTGVADSTDIAFIDSLNNGNWFKKFNDWKTEVLTHYGMK
ncbi:MAG: hypothetical protein JXR48_08060 [Candidatus Delongbacteria bacterium]|nr:hypothetical protein [Candidatus Delongbacteria bacterium]MBN2834907.1 hypothetical protein [Candidatus Delongbacteria bacterium]